MLTTPHTRRTGTSPALLLVALATAATACISSVPPPADIAPVPPPPVETDPEVPPPSDAEVAAIEEYWEERNGAFAAGPEAGLSFVVQRNHPQLPYTAEDCRQAWFGGEPNPAFREVTAVDPATIARDDGWQMPVGPLTGRDLGEGLFRMAVAFAYSGAPPYFRERTAVVHLQVAGGQVRNFFLCDTTEVTVTAASTSADGTAGGTTTGGTTTPGTSTGTGTGDAGAQPAPTQTLPPITATPEPVDGVGDGPTEEPTETGPADDNLEFCPDGAGGQPAAGDYAICPDPTGGDDTT